MGTNVNARRCGPCGVQVQTRRGTSAVQARCGAQPRRVWPRPKWARSRWDVGRGLGGKWGRSLGRAWGAVQAGAWHGPGCGKGGEGRAQLRG